MVSARVRSKNTPLILSYWDIFVLFLNCCFYGAWNCQAVLALKHILLSSGMFQRLEKFKKHAFASAMIFGENSNSSISGLCLPRLFFEVTPVWQVSGCGKASRTCSTCARTGPSTLPATTGKSWTPSLSPARSS